MNKILLILTTFALAFTLSARGHHEPFRPQHIRPRIEHHSTPSRGWYNGALIVGATLGLLDIATRPRTTTTVVEKKVIVPQPVVVQQIQPVPQQTIVVQPLQAVPVQQSNVIYVPQQVQQLSQPAVIYYTR